MENVKKPPYLPFWNNYLQFFKIFHKKNAIFLCKKKCRNFCRTTKIFSENNPLKSLLKGIFFWPPPKNRGFQSPTSFLSFGTNSGSFFIQITVNCKKMLIFYFFERKNICLSVSQNILVTKSKLECKHYQ